jgi:hypothetical protein
MKKRKEIWLSGYAPTQLSAYFIAISEKPRTISSFIMGSVGSGQA